MAASGRRSAALAGEHGDALIAVQPDEQVVQEFAAAGGGAKPRYGQIPGSYDPDRDAALERAQRLWSWGLAGWKVMAELPGPVNFAAHAAFARPEDVAVT